MRLSLFLVVFCAGLLWPPAASAAEPVEGAALRLTVRDMTGAVVVGARAELRDGPQVVARGTSDPRGVVLLGPVVAGAWELRVAAPGFADHVREGIVMTPGEQSLDLTLRLATLVEEVTVDQGALEAVIDPAGDSLTVVVREAELDALPETEEDLLAWLGELAGPDADIAVNGFLGGALPAKGRIEEVRIQRGAYSADRRLGSRARVEITTRAGLDGWGGDVAFGFRDDALNARNAFSDEDTPERMRRLLLSLQGPIVRNRTSVSLDLEALSEYETETIVALTPDGRIEDLVRHPEDELEVTLGVHHMLTPVQTLRLEYRHEVEDTDNLGVGDFDLHERGYAQQVRDRRLRLAHSGTFGGGWRNDTRLQLSRERERLAPASTAPTIDVLDTVTFGGASIRGGRIARAVQIDQRAERRLGPHTLTAGGRGEWLWLHSDEIENANGLFTFSSLEALAARRPDSYEVRAGDPNVRYRMFHGGVFLQDDIRVRSDLLLGLGLRQDWQSHASGSWNPAPRVSVSWSPRRDGRLLVRGGLGIFNRWYEADTYEETLQVDGRRVQEIVVQSPGYPDPFAGGSVVVLPSGRIQQAGDLRLPRHREATLAVERRLGRSARIDVAYTRADGTRLLRGRNVNAPDADGDRPDPTLGNVIEIRSAGRAEADEVAAGGSLRLPWQGLFIATRYTWGRSRDDGDGPLSLPADPAAPDEWGPAVDDVRHRVWVFAVAEPIRNLRLGATLHAATAPPYTITTGRDENGDGVFNDRPAGVGRNSGRAAGFARVDLRLAWRIGAGLPRQFGASSGRSGRAQRAWSADDPDWRDRHLLMSEVYMRATNVLNAVHAVRFSGVLTSPFFGQPSAAREARRIEIGARVVF